MTKHLVDLHGRVTTALRREDGQGLVEYGLILMLVALAAIVGLEALGTDVSSMFKEIGEKL
jgi:pilus assembly protein Flp/PilA